MTSDTALQVYASEDGTDLSARHHRDHSVPEEGLGWSPLPDESTRRQPVRITEVVVDDPFWNPYLERMRRITLPEQLKHMSAAGYLEALQLTWRPGDPNKPHIFWESDLAKWIEAVSSQVVGGREPELNTELTQVIDLFRNAQQPDGYLNAYFTVVDPDRRFADHQDAHELYCAGHLFEAAVAHHEATGSTALLDVARRYADLLVRRFADDGPDQGGYDGHPEVELALVRLYRATGERSYLDLAGRLIDNRGQQPFFFARQTEQRGDDGFFADTFPGRTEDPMRWAFYQQSHAPLRDQTEAVGHAVRAVYLCTGATDVALETGDAALWDAMQRLWCSVTEQKMYVTGGIGSVPQIEGFGEPYELPNRNGYGETCAAIGLANWASRLGNATSSAHYFDVMERALYNGILSGVSLEGRHYFYGNPLGSSGGYTRQEWFGTSCCPPNLARLLGSLGTHAYSTSESVLAVNLFVGSQLNTNVAGEPVRILQHADYLRSGIVQFTVDEVRSGHHFDLAVRLPSWAGGFSLSLNGHPVDAPMVNGYLVIARDWQPGDRLRLELPLIARRTYAHPAVEAARGRVALARGPVVYCLEGVDHCEPVSSLALPTSSDFEIIEADWTSVPLLTAPAYARSEDQDLYTDHPAPLRRSSVTAIPYALWGNRGDGAMEVWVTELQQSETPEHDEKS